MGVKARDNPSAGRPSPSQAPCQLQGQERECPRNLTFNLQRQMCPSLHSYSNEAPQEEVEGDAQ